MTILALAVGVTLAAPPPGRLGRADPARVAFKHGGSARAEPAPPPHAEEGWDVTHYVLDVRIDPDAQVVTGRATIEASRRSTGPLVLHANGPEISSVRVDGTDVAAQVTDGELTLEPAGDSTTVEVEWTYGGSNPTGIRWEDAAIYSFHEPSGARTWLPVHDHPADKATLDWIVTAPEGLVVAANGAFQSAITVGEWTTWHYAVAEPIATYLMAVHLSDYVVADIGETLPIYVWAYRGREAEAAASFADTPAMIEVMEGHFGPYPFASYGIAMAPFPTAMEHTTCVTFSDDLVGTEDAPLVNAHELAHHWWGNDVTPADWADIWLNEGFATYGELLWYEHQNGDEGRRAYAAYLQDAFFAWQDLEGEFPLYDPLYMWGGVVYDKGALVVHMLRWVLGEERFFAALQAYGERHALGNATTSDLQVAFEASSGEDLAWFFDQWVYGKGEPTYTWGWEVTPAGDTWQLDIVVAQDLPDFRMPVPMRVTFADGATEEVVVEVTGAEVRETVCLDREPLAVELDPEGWVLRKGEEARQITVGDAVCAEAAPEACGCDTRAGLPFGLAALSALVAASRRRR